jgi:hypothetical protein
LKDKDEVSDEYVEAAGPIFKAGEVFDKEIGATEHDTDIGEESQLVPRSKAEEMIDNEIGAADHKDAKGLGYPHHIPCQSDSVTPHLRFR